MSNKRNKRARQKALKKSTNRPADRAGIHAKSSTHDNSQIEKRLTLAIKNHQQQRLDEARELYESILKDQPENADALHFLGVLLCHQGNTRQGEHYIRQALTLAPDYFDAHNNLGNILQILGRFDEAERCYLESQRLRPDAPESFINLAAMRLAQQDELKARNYLTDALKIAPSNPQSHKMIARIAQSHGSFDVALDHLNQAIEHGTGSLQLSALIEKARILTLQDKKDDAIDLYQQWLSEHPADETAKHMLASLRGDSPPEKPGEKYVKELFDRFALSFDNVLEALDYKAPELIKHYVETLYSTGTEKLQVVDAGCGTGLCGSFLKPLADTLIGVDLSPAMLNRARILNQYDELIEDDLIRFFDSKSNEYDLIVSADTLIYLGTLDRIFAGMAQSLRVKSDLIFTLEIDPTPNDRGYRLQEHGRYCHTKEYATDCLQAAGFTINAMEEHHLRMERGEPVLGMLIAASAD